VKITLWTYNKKGRGEKEEASAATRFQVDVKWSLPDGCTLEIGTDSGITVTKILSPTGVQLEIYAGLTDPQFWKVVKLHLKEDS